jgi:hypothetical protein
MAKPNREARKTKEGLILFSEPVLAENEGTCEEGTAYLGN